MPSILRITINIGAGASLSQLESLVRATRVAVDVSQSVEFDQLERSARQRLRFPTDHELDLLAKSDNLPDGRIQERLQQFTGARRQLREPRSKQEYTQQVHWQESLESVAGSGFDRMLEARMPGGVTLGLDEIDPDLYAALIAADVATRAPAAVSVQSLRYANPVVAALTAAGEGAEALTKAAGVIDTVATLGPRRRIAKAQARAAEAQARAAEAQARVAEETADDEITRSRLEVELKQAEVRAKQIENAASLLALEEAQRRQRLIDHFLRAGQPDEAATISRLDPSDASALLEFAIHQPQLEQREEPDLPDAS